MSERITDAKAREEDVSEVNLRPKKLSEYIGQSKAKQKLEIFIGAAKERRESLDHVLLYGPPGLGKTTLAGIISNELGVNMKITSGPAIERQGDLASILTNLEPNDVLFIDEIHRLNRSVEEILYPAMEDYSLDLVIGKGPSARSVRIDISPFTLIGATTRQGLLTSPLRDRFGVMMSLELYPVKELKEIIKRSAKIMGIVIEEDAAKEMAARSRGTPRIANRLLKRVRDFAQYHGKKIIDKETADDGLKLLEVDEKGLDRMDKKILEVIDRQFGGGPVGLDSIAATVGEESATIEDVYEPFLLQMGFISRTSRGRILTEEAFKYLRRE